MSTTSGRPFTFDREASNVAVSEGHPAHLHSKPLSAAQFERRAFTRSRFQGMMACCEAAADFLTMFAAVFAADLLPLLLHANGQIGASMRDAIAISTLAALLVVLMLKGEDAYQGSGSMLRIRQTERAIRIPMQASLILFPLSFLLHLHFSGAAIVGSLVLAPLVLTIQKQIFASIARAVHERGHGGRRVAIYGGGYTGRQLLSALLDSPRLGLRPVVVIDDDAEHAAGRIFELGYRGRRSVSVRRGPATRSLLKACKCEVLMIAIPDLDPEKRSAAVHAATLAGVQVACLANPGAHEWQWTESTESIDIDDLMVTSIAARIVPRYYRVLKRLADMVFSFLLLVLFAPLLIVIALLIRLDSSGPAVFVQKRVGLNGRLFDIYKFRSMYIDVPRYDLSPATSDDRRITRIGRLLRRTSLDELPQLVNVLLGDMSLVGPRPEMPFVVEFYNSRQRQRLQVTPGITGLWQLSADRVFQIHENIEYDLYYIRNRSIFIDTAILVHTLFVAMRGV